jgi:hypothetical protein
LKTQHYLEVANNDIPFEINRRRALLQKSCFLGDSQLLIKIITVKEDSSLFIEEIRNDENMSIVVNDLKSDKVIGKNQKILIKVLEFSEGRKDFEKRCSLDYDATERYVRDLLGKSTVMSRLAGYRSSSWLLNRLSLWGIDDLNKLYFKDFGFTSVKQVERFITDLSNQNLSNDQLMRDSSDATPTLSFYPLGITPDLD